MLETDELIFEQLSSNSEEEDEQRIMFEKAGLFLEKLALNSEEQEDETINISKFLMKQELSNKSEIIDIDEAVEMMLRNKDEEIDAIQLETDILFEKFLNLDESLISPKKEAEEEKQEDEEEDQEDQVEEEEEEEDEEEEQEKEHILKINNEDIINIKDVDEESLINVENNELKTDEIILEIDKIITEKDVSNNELHIESDKIVLNEQDNERELEEAEIMLDKLAINFEEETINTMLTTVESRQNSLQEKMNALKSTAESLREQLKEERKKWKQEIKETVQLEKKLKNGKQEMKQSWDVEMDVFKDYLYFTNSKMNFERELKRRNYQNWLSEISDECDKQLTKVQSNLTVLKPLKEMVSKWNMQSYHDFNANLINNVKNTEEYVVSLIENEDIEQEQKEKKKFQLEEYECKIEENNDENNKFYMDKLDCNKTDVEEINFEMVTQL